MQEHSLGGPGPSGHGVRPCISVPQPRTPPSPAQEAGVPVCTWGGSLGKPSSLAGVWGEDGELS